MFWDVITIPLQIFELQQTTYLDTMDWMTTIFWTCDMPGSFFVGFHVGAIVEMRPKLIAARYLKTWFGLDISIVVLDWALMVATLDTFKSMGILRIGKGLRIVRVLRILRLLRLAKVMHLIKLQWDEMSEIIQSESVVTALSISQLVACIAVINHFIACCWYGIGKTGVDDFSWVAQLAEDSALDTVLWQYTTAFHWSLTQFTPASMEIVPMNVQERIFCIFVLLFAMVVFSSFISSITNAMTKLRVMNHKRTEEKEFIKRYFTDNRISLELGNRISGFLRHNIYKHKKSVHENDIAVFKILPETLRCQLHREVYEPVVLWHPYFFHFGENDGRGLSEICHTACSEEALIVRQEVFNYGERASKMWFVVCGEMEYHFGQTDSYPSGVGEHEWVCEVVLWLKWEHRGRLTASTSCELVAVDAVQFRTVVSRRKPAFCQSHAYARMFYHKILEIANESYLEFSDLSFSNFDDVQTLVQKAYDEKVFSTSHSQSLAKFFARGRSKLVFGADITRVQANSDGTPCGVLKKSTSSSLGD